MTNAVSSRWAEILRLIPGYDPFATAGDCFFDEEAAQKPIDFFAECLTHVKGEKGGQPFVLDPWQQAIVGNLFGWKRPDGTRRYREAFIYVPRKNGKSVLTSSICNFVFFCDEEWGAEIYAAAKDREQASLVFDVAKQQIMNEPVLAAECQIFKRAIVRPATGSSFKCLSSLPKHGFNPSLAIVDELHEQKNRELVEALNTGMGARRQPLMIYITTSDFDRPSICNEKHEYACKVRDGTRKNPAFLPVIYETKLGQDWRDPAVWATCNPGLGISIHRDYLQTECEKAQDVPAFENTFKRLYLNMKTEQATRAISMEKWRACGPEEPAPMEELMSRFAGHECYGGLDLATTTDVAAFVLLFPGDRLKVLPFFWIPEDTARAKEKRDEAPYLTWARQGYVRMTEGSVIDFDRIRDQIVTLSKTFAIKEVAVDRWNATQICEQLIGDGLDLIAFGQGFKDMTAPTKELNRRVIAGGIEHFANPVLAWMASNLMVVTDHAGNMKPTKAKASGKIDGIVALIMAIGRAMVAKPKRKSVYESRGLLRI